MNIADTGRASRDDAVLWMLIVFLVGLGLGGGSSGGLPLLLLRPGAVILLWMVLMLRGERLMDREARLPLAFASLCLTLMVIQIVPLPPEVWTSLPGREVFADSAKVAGMAQPWRPLTLTPGPTMNGLVALVIPIAVMVAVLCVGSRGVPILFGVLLLMVLLSAVLGMFQMADGPDSPLRYYRVTNRESAVGLFANRNHQAFFLVLGFPLLGFFAKHFLLKRSLGLSLAAMLMAGSFLLVAIMFTGSRMGLILAVLAIPLTFAAFRPRFQLPLKGVIVGAAGALGVLAGLVYLGIGRSEALVRLVSKDPADDLRFALFPDFTAMAREFFPVGSGFGSFQHVYRHFERLETITPRYVNHAHNDVIQIVIEGGLPALLLLVIFLGWGLLKVRMLLLAGASDSGRAAGICVLTLLLASSVDYPLRTPLLTAVFVCMATIVAQMRGGENSQAVTAVSTGRAV